MSYFKKAAGTFLGGLIIGYLGLSQLQDYAKSAQQKNIPVIEVLANQDLDEKQEKQAAKLLRALNGGNLDNLQLVTQCGNMAKAELQKLPADADKNFYKSVVLVCTQIENLQKRIISSRFILEKLAQGKATPAMKGKLADELESFYQTDETLPIAQVVKFISYAQEYPLQFPEFIRHVESLVQDLSDLSQYKEHLSAEEEMQLDALAAKINGPTTQMLRNIHY